MKLITRILEPNESKLYREIRLDSLREYPEYFGSKYEEQAKLTKLYFEKIIEENSPSGIMAGIFDKDEIVGICGVTFETKVTQNAGEIIQMYIKRTYQGNRLGGKLLECIYENIKKDKNIEHLILGVDKNNIAAIKTYYNFGFQINTNIKEENGILYMSLTI